MGTLILIVGPSGSGKDTLLDAARAHFQDSERLLFCERVITRADQIGERHIVVSDAEFQRRKKDGGFFLSWRAHDLQYGIDSKFLAALQAGISVTANVSRQIVTDARKKWPHTQVIHVTASREIRRERLITRGREAREAIEARVARADRFDDFDAAWLSRLENSGALTQSVERFIGLIAKAISAETDSAREF